VTRSRTTLRVREQSVLALTRESPDTLTVLLVGPGYLETTWRIGAHVTAGAGDVELALTDAEGRAVVGDSKAPLDRQSVRTASVTNLPWTVHAVARDTAAVSLSSQAVLMLSGIVVMMLVVATGGYFITRALGRELRVARLQSDFVAAVSHEFRSPLTTVRQLSELLASGRVSTEGRREEFYGILAREGERLHRLVESLLNFARLEAGELAYRFEALSLGSFVRELVDEARKEFRGVHIELIGDERPLAAIQADRDLLGLVFWNLLDNAVKYSPDRRRVEVEVDTAGQQVVVQVRDRGMGIPASEQREIFGKFVRGAAAKTAGIKGTGIGLSMAREIVRAHGGDITVESEVGVGSTFTVALPIQTPGYGLPAPAGTGRRAPEAWSPEPDA
jgi:signal transduction histidine kinase